MIAKNLNFLLTMDYLDNKLITSANNNICSRINRRAGRSRSMLTLITHQGVKNAKDKISKFISFVISFCESIRFFSLFERLTHSLKLFVTKGIYLMDVQEYRNEIVLRGESASQAEIVKTVSGRKICTLSLATSSCFKNISTEECQEDTDYHRLVFWGKLIQQVMSLEICSPIEIYGSLRYSRWEDPYGLTGSCSEVWVHRFKILDRKNINFNGGS